jgi:single-strand DNA-binding protein
LQAPFEGKLCTRKWQDQSAADRYTTEIHLTPYNGVLIFLNGRRDGDPAAAAGTADGRIDVAGTNSNLDDEIPF